MCSLSRCDGFEHRANEDNAYFLEDKMGLTRGEVYGKNKKSLHRRVAARDKLGGQELLTSGQLRARCQWMKGAAVEVVYAME